MSARFVVVDNAVAEPVRAALSASIAASKLIGESQLTGGFSATRGFGIACHVSALDEALRKAPFLEPFVAVALDDALRARARPPSLIDRVGGALFGDVNALYLNVLVVPPGGAVEKHTDATLGTSRDDDRALVPRAVCALYVDVPSDLTGGVLRLTEGNTVVGEVTPAPRRLVMFDGRLAHEVTATQASGPRTSCVCELYRLPRARLRTLPRVRVQSRGFDDVLARLRPPTPPE